MTASGEPLLPIVNDDADDEFVEMVTDDGVVYWVNFARDQTCATNPNEAN